MSNSVEGEQEIVVGSEHINRSCVGVVFYVTVLLDRVGKLSEMKNE